MKTLEEIKQEYADGQGYDNWDQYKYKVLKYDVEEFEKTLFHITRDLNSAAVHQALDEAAGRNYEMYRELMDRSEHYKDDPEDEYQYRRMKAKAVGYKYAAKQTQELKEKY